MRARTGSALGRAARERGGYTLVELVVVMAIIAALAALILGAVAKSRDVGQRTTVRSELSQIDTACAAFKKDFGFNPPQTITLPRHGMQASWSLPEQRGAQLLTKMFRGYDPTLPATPVVTFRGASGTASTPLTLTGVQSLVFFLGGPNQQGFQKTQPQPAAPNTNSKTGPYYEFPEPRFFDPDTNTATLDYRDVWGTPYAYFSSGTAGGDNYDQTYAWPIPDRAGPPVMYLAPFRLGGAATSPWANPGKVQIISAGPDKVFGTFYNGTPFTSRGTAEWTPGQGEYGSTNAVSFGADDLANFNGTVSLGSPGN